MSRYLVYGLIDPRSQELRYVGETKNTLSRRLKEHLWHARRGDPEHVYRWLRKLLDEGVEPEVFEVEVCGSKQEMDESERFHIAYFQSIGCRLTNHSAGGDGRNGPCTEEHKRKVGAANMGKRRTLEERARMAAAHRGLPSPNRGRSWSDEYKAKMTKCQGGRRLVDENGIVYESANDAARRLGTSAGSVSNAARSKCKTAGGHTFSYLTE